jgi:NADPH-dependent 2,4-dienoyl-CoA reductase/sulfur reductase-like enzyme/rhodanese-related sulfurtransferase
MKRKNRILIVGGVAGGASCATRARRLCERCEIVMFDRGPYVSFANCGLPYHVGDVIEDERALLVATPELFRDRFDIEVRTLTEVTAIDREKCEIEVQDLTSGETRRESYDALVLSPGARAIRPPLPGIDLPGIHVVRTIPDTRRIRDSLAGSSRAVVIGGGFIGLEMAENLVRRGLEVTLVELAPQVMASLDQEMAAYIEDRLITNGVELRLGVGVEGFEPDEDGRLVVKIGGDERLVADLAILAIGVRPEVTLAEQAGLELGDGGGIRVDDRMCTSDPRVFAVGDAIEVRNVVTGDVRPLALAGPANRQGRIAAASIHRALGSEPTGSRREDIRFRGVQATAVCGVFGLTVASTGANERALESAGLAYERVYLHPGNHVGYFPGAKPIHIKLLFAPDDGRILGVQAVGEADVARRVDVISMAIQMGGTVFDLEECELCYAPQYGAAKDPVNLAGMIAANLLRGDLSLAAWDELTRADVQLLDVRTVKEFERGHIPGSVNTPLEELRQRLEELPNDRPLWLICGVGQRAYYATRALRQNGYDVSILSGGMATWEVVSRETGAPIIPAATDNP